MSDTKLRALADEIAAAFDLNSERLLVTLVKAVEEHDTAVSMWRRRDASASHIPKVAKLEKALKGAHQRWLGLTQQERNSVLWFISPETKDDEVEERLIFLADLLEEFREHHVRDRGNQGKARTGKGSDLKPLSNFVHVLMDFWKIETGRPVGHAVETADEIGASVRDAKSPFMEFLNHATSCLEEGYSIGSLETVVRNLKERSAGA